MGDSAQCVINPRAGVSHGYVDGGGGEVVGHTGVVLAPPGDEAARTVEELLGHAELGEKDW